MPLSSSNAPRQLSDGNSQGTVLGQSATDPISFYGASPVARGAATITVSTVLSSANGPASIAGYGCSSVAQMNAIITGVNALITDVALIRSRVVALGLVTST